MRFCGSAMSIRSARAVAPWASAAAATTNRPHDKRLVSVANDRSSRLGKAVHSHRYKRYYGSPRMADELVAKGHVLTRHKTARIMRKYGLRAATRRRFVRTTESKHGHAVAPNPVDRCFEVGESNRTWCADITYLNTPNGWFYLAVVINLGTRKWIGYAVGTNMNTDLVEEALSMALTQELDKSDLMHTDQGSQYASEQHRAMLRRNGITMSMSRKANCWDNAVTESFIGTFKNEAGDPFVDEHDARATAFDYQAFFNRERRHSTLANQTPLQFEMELQNTAS